MDRHRRWECFALYIDRIITSEGKEGKREAKKGGSKRK